MSLSQYTRTALQNAVVDSTIDVNIGSQIAIQDAINAGVRKVYLDLDLRSAKRKAVITPNIFDDVYVYTAPSDLKDYAVIDVAPQAYGTRSLNSRIKLVPPEVFDRKKSDRNLIVSVLDDDMTRKLLVNIDVDDTEVDVSSLDSLTADGSDWAAFGDATNVVLDGDNKVEGSGSVKFDLVGSGTTAGIVNAGLTEFSVATDIVNSGVALAWVYINSTTNLTNWIIRIGSSPSAYYQMTATSDHAGNSFVAGWNLIRWNFSGKTTTGSPNNGAINYVTVYMTKTSGKSDDSYRVDDIQLHLGEIYEVFYYSKYPWQRDNQTYAENSAGATDYINADTDEIDLIAASVKMEIARRRRDYDELKLSTEEYKELKRVYQLTNPSERAKLETTYYRF